MKIQALVLSAALCMGTSVFAGPITYTADLNGANQNPVNASPGTGFATVVLDISAHTLGIDVTFADLTTPTTAAHIHCCVADPGNVGVATQTPQLHGIPVRRNFRQLFPRVRYHTRRNIQLHIRYRERRYPGGRGGSAGGRLARRRSLLQHPHHRIPQRRDTGFSGADGSRALFSGALRPRAGGNRSASPKA